MWVAPASSVTPEPVAAPAVVQPTPGEPSAAPTALKSPDVNPSTGHAASAVAAPARPVKIKPTVGRSDAERAVLRARMDARRPLNRDDDNDGEDDSEDLESVPTPTILQQNQDDPPVVQRNPTEVIMLGGGSFDGDLRNLPQATVRQRERVEREVEVNPTLLTGRDGTVLTPSYAPPEPGRGIPAPAPILTFEGLGKNPWGSAWPADANIDVGPNHIIETVNSSVGIFSKAGAQLAAFTLDTFMSQGAFGNICDNQNFGDPLVLYDTFEDRWVITDLAFELDGGGNVSPQIVYECFAVSKTSDPVAGGWNFYSLNTTGGLGDYPKIGIWPDGLYVSFNMFNYAAGGGFQNVRLYAFNKAQMYAGGATVQVVQFDLPSTEYSLLPANARLQTGTPPAGSPNYFTSVYYFSNAISVWKFDVDWAHVALSTLTGPVYSMGPGFTSLTSVGFRVPTSANSLDSLYPRLMMQNQYSNIGGVESLWNSHTVGTSGAPTQASVRYYQVRVTGGTIEPASAQVATHTPDTLHRFMPSVAVNKNGDMAIGYNVTDTGMHPGIRYAGRLAADPINTLPQTEQIMTVGAGSQSHTTRWGDYATMTLDPDGCTFWLIGEYYQATGSNWNTRIGSFQLPGCTAEQTGSLTGTVKTAGNVPIPNATVKLGVRTALTNAAGEYSFSGLPDGAYPTVTATGSGYSTSTFTNIVVPGGGGVVQDFALTSAAPSGCFMDTTQLDFQGDVPAVNCDLNAVPGSVVLANPAAIDQQNTTVTNGGFTFGITTAAWAAQTFTVARSGPLTRVDLLLFCANGGVSCSGTPVDITVAIRAMDGIGTPTGADLAVTTIPGFNSGAGAYFSAIFATPATVTAGVKYAVIVRLPVVRGVANPGLYAWACSCNDNMGGLNTNPYAGGQRMSSTSSGGSWTVDNTEGGRDNGFKVFTPTGYAAEGTFTSSLKDANPVAGGYVNWNTIAWNIATPAGTGVEFRVAGSDSPNGPFNFVGPGGTAGPADFFTSGASLAQFNGKRYLRYQAKLTSPSPVSTPQINDVTVCFTTTPRPLLDLNADGTGDVFTYESSSGVWKRQVSQGNGTFAETGPASPLFNWAPGWSVMPARFNSDNYTDFFLFNPANGNWYKMLNDGASGFTEAASGSWFNGWQRFVIDLDGDEIDDIFLYDSFSGAWFKCISTPSGFNYIQGGWNPDWEITLMKLNGDALGDMFLFNRTTGRWFWVLGDPGASFQYPITWGWTTSWNFYPGDFNGDGLTDMLLHDVPTGQYYVAMHNGVNDFNYTVGYWVTGWTPHVGDLDADGDQDLFLYQEGTGAWYELLSDGVGGFTEGGGQMWSTGWQIHMTDLNADGRSDVLLYNPSTGVWYQARNLTIGTFSYTNGVWATGLTIIVRTPYM